MPGIIDERRFGFITWEGATSAETYIWYAGLAALLRPSRILEIGTFDGVSTAALYSGAKVFGHQPQFFCVDLSIRAEKIRNNFRAMGVGGKDLAENFIFCEGDSRKVLPEIAKFGMKFDLILIDGCHDERFVREDWKNAKKLLAPRGVVIFHDITLFPWLGKILDEIEDYKIQINDQINPKWDVWRWRGSDYPPGHRMFGEHVYLRDRGNEGFAMVRRRDTFETPADDVKDFQGLRMFMKPVMEWEKGWGYDQTHVIPNIDPDKPSEEVEFPSTPKKLKLIAGEDTPAQGVAEHICQVCGKSTDGNTWIDLGSGTILCRPCSFGSPSAHRLLSECPSDG